MSVLVSTKTIKVTIERHSLISPVLPVSRSFDSAMFIDG